MTLLTDFSIQGAKRVRNRVPKGVKRVKNRVPKGRKRPNTVHLRPNTAGKPYPTVTWIYPTLALDVTGLA